MSEPTIRRKFVLMDPLDNHNKDWEILYWADTRLARTTWGRVGKNHQSKDFPGVGMSFVDGRISEKIIKGYQELELHVPGAIALPTSKQVIQFDPKIQQLLSRVGATAKAYINSYLAAAIDSLSANQLNKGRIILNEIAACDPVKDKAKLPGLVKLYYNVIPTQLPNKLDIDDLVYSIIRNLHEQEDRLDQLTEAVTAEQPDAQPTIAAQPIPGVDMAVLAQTAPEYGSIVDYVKRTSGGYRGVDSIFVIRIGHERQAYLAEQFGKDNRPLLFHGTAEHNIKHILRQGLIIPQHVANGSRFGRGIYFSDKAKRSLNYTDARSNPILFVNQVKVGTPWVNSGSDGSLRAAPQGFHSVHGTGSWSDNGDEFVVYKSSQTTMRFVVVLNK